LTPPLGPSVAMICPAVLIGCAIMYIWTLFGPRMVSLGCCWRNITKVRPAVWNLCPGRFLFMGRICPRVAPPYRPICCVPKKKVVLSRVFFGPIMSNQNVSRPIRYGTVSGGGSQRARAWGSPPARVHNHTKHREKKYTHAVRRRCVHASGEQSKEHRHHAHAHLPR
jgi:hypothetical protein